MNADWAGSPQDNHREILQTMLTAIGGADDKIFFDLYPKVGYGLELAETTNAAVYSITDDTKLANTIFAWRKKNAKPILPLLCNIWDRSLHSSLALRDGCDVVYVMPNLFETAVSAKVPLDFVGRVLSLLTRSTAVVGIGEIGGKQEFPWFVCPSETNGDPIKFVRRIVGKYFKWDEVVKASENSKAILLILQK
jgi:hypothetical protein